MLFSATEVRYHCSIHSLGLSYVKKCWKVAHHETTISDTKIRASKDVKQNCRLMHENDFKKRSLPTWIPLLRNTDTNGNEIMG